MSFEKTGPQITEAVLRIAKQRAKQLGIKKILVASTTGNVAIKALEVLKWLKVFFVSHGIGFSEANVQRFTEENRKMVESRDGMILTATHVFIGLSRSRRHKTNTVAIGDLVAETLRIFSHGTKVACEISMMAVDAGLVRTDENIISVGITSKRSDTALGLTRSLPKTF